MTEEQYISMVCENIKRIRLDQKMKQIELASEVGIDDSSLRRIESGRTSPTLKTLFRIAKALNVSVSELVGEFDSKD